MDLLPSDLAQLPLSTELGRVEDPSPPLLHSPVPLSPLLASYAWMGLERARGLGGFLAALLLGHQLIHTFCYLSTFCYFLTDV